MCMWVLYAALAECMCLQACTTRVQELVEACVELPDIRIRAVRHVCALLPDGLFGSAGLVVVLPQRAIEPRRRVPWPSTRGPTRVSIVRRLLKVQVNFLLHLLGPLFPASPSLLLSTPSSCISDHSHWPFDPCLAADLVKEIANLRFVICRQRLTRAPLRHSWPAPACLVAP